MKELVNHRVPSCCGVQKNPDSMKVEVFGNPPYSWQIKCPVCGAEYAYAYDYESMAKARETEAKRYLSVKNACVRKMKEIANLHSISLVTENSLFLVSSKVWDEPRWGKAYECLLNAYHKYAEMLEGVTE